MEAAQRRRERRFRSWRHHGRVGAWRPWKKSRRAADLVAVQQQARFPTCNLVESDRCAEVASILCVVLRSPQPLSGCRQFCIMLFLFLGLHFSPPQSWMSLSLVRTTNVSALAVAFATHSMILWVTASFPRWDFQKSRLLRAGNESAELV